MAGITKVAELEERKRALVEESEVYREMLHLQIRNAQLYGLTVRDKFRSFNTSNPLFLLAIPLVTRLLGRSAARRGPLAKFKWLGTAVALWPVVKRLAPLLFRFISRQRVRSRMQRAAEPEARVPAAAI